MDRMTAGCLSTSTPTHPALPLAPSTGHTTNMTFLKLHALCSLASKSTSIHLAELQPSSAAHNTACDVKLASSQLFSYHLCPWPQASAKWSHLLSLELPYSFSPVWLCTHCSSRLKAFPSCHSSVCTVYSHSSISKIISCRRNTELFVNLKNTKNYGEKFI